MFCIRSPLLIAWLQRVASPVRTHKHLRINWDTNYVCTRLRSGDCPHSSKLLFLPLMSLGRWLLILFVVVSCPQPMVPRRNQRSLCVLQPHECIFRGALASGYVSMGLHCNLLCGFRYGFHHPHHFSLGLWV